MKIAITGANGFVGSTLLTHLHHKGFEPLAFVRKPFRLNSIPVRIVDYSNPNTLSRALSDVDVLIHNAGMTKSVSRGEMLAANVGITRNVVQAVNQAKHPIRLIYISSQAASGPSSAQTPRRESDALAPISIYGKSKAIAERVVQTQCSQAWNIVRPCSVYGPGDRDFLSLFRLCNSGFSLQIGKKERPLNMIHVSQLADFLLHLIMNQQVMGEIFFATDNQVYTQALIVDAICAAIGKKSRRLIVPEALAHLAFGALDGWGRLRSLPSAMNLEKYHELSAEGWVADPQKAQGLLGWNPPAMLPELICETYRWYRENSWL
jgi:nucleoside-diphosphate-sugar epimerase